MHEVGKAGPQGFPLCPICWLPSQASVSLLCSRRAPSAQATEPTTDSWGSSESQHPALWVSHPSPSDPPRLP